MPSNTPSLFQNFAELLWVVVAAFGGIARYLDLYIRTGMVPKFGILLAHSVVSGFSGYMFAQVVLRFQPDWAMVAAGIGGYLGTHGLEWLTDALRRRFAKTISPCGCNCGKCNNGCNS